MQFPKWWRTLNSHTSQWWSMLKVWKHSFIFSISMILRFWDFQEALLSIASFYHSNKIVCNVLIFTNNRIVCSSNIQFSSPKGLHFKFMNWIQFGGWTGFFFEVFSQWKMKNKCSVNWLRKKCELNFSHEIMFFFCFSNRLSLFQFKQIRSDNQNLIRAIKNISIYATVFKMYKYFEIFETDWFVSTKGLTHSVCRLIFCGF